jgi:CRP/FNR family transcriptional regulator
MTAIEDTHVCAVAYPVLIACMGQDPGLQRRVGRLMGQEIAGAQRAMTVLGLLTAQERLAVFLLDLSRRFSARGYSARDFNLCMTRAEIGSLLGITHETVSRGLSALQRQGQLQIDNRRVQLTDLAAFSRRYGALLPS